MSGQATWRARPITEADRANLAAWIEADQDHRGRCTPDFWISPAPGAEMFAIEPIAETKEAKGQLIYVRCENVMRVHIQFAPVEQGAKLPVSRLLMAGLGWLMVKAKQRKYREIVFDSTSEALTGLCKRLGFRERRDEYSLEI